MLAVESIEAIIINIQTLPLVMYFGSRILLCTVQVVLTTPQEWAQTKRFYIMLA